MTRTGLLTGGLTTEGLATAAKWMVGGKAREELGVMFSFGEFPVAGDRDHRFPQHAAA